MRATSQSITKIINHQIVRFALVGLIITLLNFLLYNFFVYALNLSPGLSTILAFCVLIPPHLMSNWRWVFKATDKNKFWLILKYSFALCFLALSNYLAVQFFWAYLLLDPAPSQFLNLAVNVPVSYFLFKYLVFREPSTSKTSIEIIIFILACLFAYLIILHSLTGVFTYTNVIPVKDDWRHLNDYLFEKSLWESIFDRQNNHLMILPNLFFLANLYILNGQTSNLAFLNIGLWGASGLIIAFLANKHITKTSNKLGPLFLTLCILAIMFVITSSSTQFWGIGIHNHFVVFFATVCAFVLSAGSQQISSLKTVSFFVVLAFLASASFSTGLALWALGGAAAISQKNSLRVIFTYIIIGIIPYSIMVGKNLPSTSDGIASLI